MSSIAVPLQAGRVRTLLEAADLPLSLSVEVFDSVDSTNAAAARAAAQHSGAGLWLADQQTAGRGRRGKTWVSPAGSNLYMSLLWWTQADVAALGGASLAVGVAVADTLQALGLDSVRLKWPNDILVEHAKLGGILVEILQTGQKETALVIGVGLNLFMPAEQARLIDQSWTQLANHIPSVPARNELAAQLAITLVHCLQRFEVQGLAGFTEQWQTLDAMAGRNVRVVTGDSVALGRAVGVAPDGALRMRLEDGRLETFYAGEVSLRLQE